MQEDIQNHIRIILKRIDKLAQESSAVQGFNSYTNRLKLLSELVREQTEADEIIYKGARRKPQETK